MAINDIPPEVAANNAQRDAINDDLRRTIENQGEANSVQTEALFYENLALREVANKAQTFADGFVRFVETREHSRLNHLAQSQHRDTIPYPDVAEDWASWGAELNRENDRERQSMDRLGNLIHGDEPQEMQDTRNATDDTRAGMNSPTNPSPPAPLPGEDQLSQEDTNLTQGERDLDRSV